VDPKTGELIFFSWRTEHPFAYYSVISGDGRRVVWEEPIPGIMKIPYIVDGHKHKSEGKPVIYFDPNTPTQFGIIPRYFDGSKHEVVWFESRACHIFHTANAWNETDADGNVVAICLTACRSERFISQINLWQPPTPGGYGGGVTEEEYKTEYGPPGSGDYTKQQPDEPFMTLFRFDFKTKETQMTTLSTIGSEFPVINFDRYTQPDLKYVYGATTAPLTPNTGIKFDGIVKTDILALIKRKNELLSARQLKNAGGEGQWELGVQELQSMEKHTTQRHTFGPHTFGSEA
ncbi:hypothetical protein BGZ99_003270, partial [Dissophora globulifera]